MHGAFSDVLFNRASVETMMAKGLFQIEAEHLSEAERTVTHTCGSRYETCLWRQIG